jgi:hypothetical protein
MEEQAAAGDASKRKGIHWDEPTIAEHDKVGTARPLPSYRST